MTLRTLVLTALAAATLTGAVQADERTYLTPPLYREQARVTATVRPASELITTPSVVVAAATPTCAAWADDRAYLTPPLYREQARVTATLRPASELTTTPSVTPRAAPTRRVVAEAIERTAR
ncbi:hypothetical protein [Methylobacterium flocculans]|uniref:hypothetical protein n=1 Tax=Methylobacterium flocculans TaxID=2984843 RepID=UPI00298ED3A0|nr:hypothetical protein [Methylobacterium sp. FF17]